jgi:hypothetical protein
MGASSPLPPLRRRPSYGGCPRRRAAPIRAQHPIPDSRRAIRLEGRWERRGDIHTDDGTVQSTACREAGIRDTLASNSPKARGSCARKSEHTKTLYARETPHPSRAPTSGDGEKSSVAAIFLFLLASELPDYLFSPHHICDGSNRLDGWWWEGLVPFYPLARGNPGRWLERPCDHRTEIFGFCSCRREGEGRFRPPGPTRQWPNTRVGVEPGRGGRESKWAVNERTGQSQGKFFFLFHFLFFNFNLDSISNFSLNSNWVQPYNIFKCSNKTPIKNASYTYKDYFIHLLRIYFKCEIHTLLRNTIWI